MKIERLQMSIQTVKESIAILESKEPEDAGYYLQLEHEKMVLDALEKRMPKRPIINKSVKVNGFMLYCPNADCEAVLQSDSPCCKYCGQSLYWSDHPTEKGGAEQCHKR